MTRQAAYPVCMHVVIISHILKLQNTPKSLLKNNNGAWLECNEPFKHKQCSLKKKTQLHTIVARAHNI